MARTLSCACSTTWRGRLRSRPSELEGRHPVLVERGCAHQQSADEVLLVFLFVESSFQVQPLHVILPPAGFGSLHERYYQASQLAHQVAATCIRVVRGGGPRQVQREIVR